jgi:hypothetical protein
MRTGVISFCDRISYNIKCPDVKDYILNELEKKYNIRILQKHWFRMDDNQYKYIKQVPHKVCIRSNGNPYFLYFTRYDDVPQIMYIDKKVQPNYQKPRIILTRGQFADCLFDNTLIEGEMVKDIKNQWIFLINDIIMYQGKSLKDIELPQRITYAHEMLANHYTADDIIDVCSFQIKKYVPATTEAVEELIEFSKELQYTSRGIYFVPYSLKYKPKLINFNDSLIKSVFRKVKDCPEFMDSVTPVSKETKQSIDIEVQKVSSTDDNLKTYWLRKTDQPDIYDIYESENSLDKIGIVSVPSMQTSKMLRNVFKNMNVATSVLFQCVFDARFNNWVPVKHIVEK